MLICEESWKLGRAWIRNVERGYHKQVFKNENNAMKWGVTGSLV